MEKKRIAPDELQVNIEVQKAATGEIHRCTAAIFDPELPESGVSSGVFISVADRVFLATTQHSARRHARLIFVSMELRDIEEHPVVARRYLENFERDIACLEIDPEAPATIGRIPIGLDRVGIVVEGKRLVFVVGFPSQLVRSEERGRLRYDLRFQVVGHCNGLLPERDWPEATPSLSPANDLVMPYDTAAEPFRFPGTSPGPPDPIPEPYGMSGGGWWQSESCADRLWVPDRMKLVGIQRQWPGKANLCATQIHHWLRLLHDNEPDLQAILKSHFEFLRTP